jgi:hypothetical protein
MILRTRRLEAAIAAAALLLTLVSGSVQADSRSTCNYRCKGNAKCVADCRTKQISHIKGLPAPSRPTQHQTATTPSAVVPPHADWPKLIQVPAGPMVQVPAPSPGQTNSLGDRVLRCQQAGSAAGLRPGQLGSFTGQCIGAGP